MQTLQLMANNVIQAASQAWEQEPFWVAIEVVVCVGFYLIVKRPHILGLE